MRGTLTMCLLAGFGLVLSSVALSATPDELDLALPDDINSLLMGEEQKSNLMWSGYLKNETAYRFDEPRSFTKIRNIFSLNSDYDFSRTQKFHASGWYYHDAVYNLFQSYETITARRRRDEDEPLVFVEGLEEEKDSNVLELREFYLDLFLPKVDIRVGKQWVIWGVIPGVRVVDEINPMNFRELILPDLLDYRISLWTFKADFYHKKDVIQFLWIPDLKFHQPAPSGSEWELFQVLPATSKPQSWNPKFSEFGLRYTTHLFDAEVAFSYFYTWDDYPTTFRVISGEELRRPEPTTELAILPTYSRMTMYGMTLTKEVKGDIFKAEFAYVTGKYFAIVDVDRDQNGYLDRDGEMSRDHARWAVGYDFSLWGADFSPSFSGLYILNYDSDILSDQHDQAFNLFIRKPIQKRSAVFTLLMIRLINFGETYYKPKFTFNVTNNFQVMAGLDIFTGQNTQFGRAASQEDPGGLVDIEQRAQFLGNFGDNRRIFLEFKYSF